MSKTQRYFHPLQSDKFRAGMQRIREYEAILKALDAARIALDEAEVPLLGRIYANEHGAFYIDTGERVNE